MELSDDRIWELAEVHTKYDRNIHVVFFARAIEAEVRKQDESLIRQMLEIIESVTCDSVYEQNCNVCNTVESARARINQ